MTETKRLLLIENNRDVLRVMQIIVEQAGFEVAAYDRCTPAEVHLAAQDIDIALLDVRIPDRCGDDFGKELHARCPKTTIIFLTGEACVEPLKTAIPGCFVLRKPIDVDELLELLKSGSQPAYQPGLDEQSSDQAGAM